MKGNNMHTTRIQPPSPKRLLRRTLLVGTVVAALVLAMIPRPALALFGFDIIFDPTNFAENVRQVARLVEQIAKFKQQIENELKMLAHLRVSELSGMTKAVQRVEQVLLDSGEYANPNPGGDLTSRYPTDFGNAPRDVIEHLQPAWNDTYRQALAENRQVQNQVYSDMDSTAERVTALVEASNNAEGVTSAVQAHNELLAEASTELSKLQMLKVTRARMKTERLARDQSDLAYRRVRRDAAMQDADAPGGTAPVEMPFGN
jgi:conjugal transfer/entry exclusion protein